MAGNPRLSKWYAVPRAQRNIRGTELLLSPESHTALDELAKALHLSRSRVVDMILPHLSPVTEAGGTTIGIQMPRWVRLPLPKPNKAKPATPKLKTSRKPPKNKKRKKK